METFFKTHKYLIEHLGNPVHRLLMDEINWEHRLIGIKGSRSVGKTTFLLDYVQKNFGTDPACLYVNLNNFYFTGKSIIEFAAEFQKKGGKVLLLDQIFKYPNWSQELRYCYDNFPNLKIVFTGSTIMKLDKENLELSGCVDSYYLRGFSFREFLNKEAQISIRPYSFEEIIGNHKEIAQTINNSLKGKDILAYYADYIRYGYYPFYLEQHDFSENLLKTLNLVLEIDVLLLNQTELSYLPKLRKLLYLIACNGPYAPNVSQLSTDLQISRATVMNYIKCLKDARLINILYPKDSDFPKKPERIYLQNPNMIYAFCQDQEDRQIINETFFYMSTLRKHAVNSGIKAQNFLVDETWEFCVTNKENKKRKNASINYAVDGITEGENNQIPLWIFGFLY